MSTTTFPITVETEVWVPRGDGSGYLDKVRTKTVSEVHRELVAILGEENRYGAPPFESVFVTVPGAEEYFDPSFGWDDREWPSGQIAAFAVTGGSEGHYVHVEVLDDRQRHLVLLGKTFDGKDAAWALARRLADLLGV